MVHTILHELTSSIWFGPEKASREVDEWVQTLGVSRKCCIWRYFSTIHIKKASERIDSKDMSKWKEERIVPLFEIQENWVSSFETNIYTFSQKFL